jgi:hypothetical protein
VHCINHGSNLAGGDTVTALTPFNNAKKCAVLGIHAYVLMDQSRTRFLAMGDAAVRQFQQLPASIRTIRIVVRTTTDSRVRTRGNAILRSLTSKSYLISVSIEAMVVYEVNFMNRRNQGRRLNFSSYRVDLILTTARLKAMKDRNECM